MIILSNWYLEKYALPITTNDYTGEGGNERKIIIFNMMFE